MPVPHRFKVGRTVTSNGTVCYWLVLFGRQFIVANV